MTSFTTTLTYSAPLLRRAVRTFVWRRAVTSKKLLLALALLLISIALWLFAETLPIDAAAVPIAGLLVLILFEAAIWRAHDSQTMRHFRQLSPPTSDVTATLETMAIKSNLGSHTLPWSRFTEVWMLPDYWMLFFGPSAYMTVPISGLDPAQRAFLAARLPQPSYVRT